MVMGDVFGESGKRHQAYQQAGGKLDYFAWMSAGQPTTPTPKREPTPLSPYGAGIYEEWVGGLPPETTVAPSTVRPEVEAGLAAKGVDEEPPDGGDLMPLQFRTYEEALKAAPEGWDVDRDEFGYFTIKRAPAKAREEMPEGFYKSYKEAASAAPEGWAPFQASGGWFGIREEGMTLEQREAEEEARWRKPYQEKFLQREQLAQRQREAEMQQQQAEAELGFRESQARIQQQEQERQTRAQLMANPMSWLQYSAYTGETPGVQPWMLPLGTEQYQVGEALPGWQAGQAEGQPMSSLEQLRTPSAQLWSRMGPTAQAQYAGYKQARTGQRPEETIFRQQAGAPPGGRGGLRWLR